MKKKIKDKKIFYLIALVALIAIGLFLKYRTGAKPVVNQEIVEEEMQSEQESKTEVSFTKKDIDEKNFTGTTLEVVGTSPLAVASRNYINQNIGQFKTEADKSVPDMREQFGADNPSATYTIDLSANEVESDSTKSIVIESYVYTGGANGNTYYKVITASKKTGEVLTLNQIIKKDKQTEFTKLVKKELRSWRTNEVSSGVLFEDAIDELTFDSFKNWSLDSKSLNLYFDEYEIGPGVLGSLKFPMPLSKIKDFLKTGY